MSKKRHLKQQMCSLIETKNGFEINTPVPKGLVISGGGAKGLAYAGMFQAMEERGLIKQLTHVAGASAGAMTSSFLAVGMSAETILKISTQLDITKLLDNKNLLSRAEGTRVRNVFELLYILQIKQHMSMVEEPKSAELLNEYHIINQKIRIYERILRARGIEINTIEDLLSLANTNEDLKRLDNALAYLPKKMKDQHEAVIETPKITFKDLTRLRNLLPEDQKHLIKHLSVVTTNQTKQEMETYSEDLGCESSIAEKVQQSGAHPILFKPVKNEEGHSIADGGIKNNMPTKALENVGLKPEEILCAKAETGAKFAARINKVATHSIEAVSGMYSFMDSIITDILGGRLFEGCAKVLNREKIFYQLGNMLYLNTGEIDTTTTSPTETQRTQTIKTAYNDSLKFIDGRTKIFDNALIAMLYLGIEKLDQALINTDWKNPLFVTAALAKKVFLLQNAIAEELQDNHWDSTPEMIEQIEKTILETDLTLEQKNQAFSLCLKQINYFSAGTLERFIIDEIKKEQGPAVNWFIELLTLLWQPIEWVLSLGSNTAPEISNTEEEISNTEEEKPAQEDQQIITALRAWSFLSYKEVSQSDELDKTAPSQPSNKPL